MAVILTVALLGAGCVYFNTYYNANKYFKQAERQNQGNTTGGVGANRRLYEDAILKAQKIVDKHPNSKYHDDALFMIGVCYFRMEDFPRSERYFRELLATHSQTGFLEESQLYLARCRMFLGDQQAGFRTFTELATTAQKPAWRSEAHYQRGLYFLETEMYDSAAAAFTTVFTDYQDTERSNESRLQAAAALRRIGRPLGAIEIYRPLRDDQDLVLQFKARAGIGSAYLDAGNFDSSIAVFERMAANDDFYDSTAIVRLALGRAYEGIGDQSAAWRQYERVAAGYDLTSWSGEAHFRMAEIKQFREADLLAAKEFYDASRQQDSRGELANLALTRSANITRLEQFRKDLGRGGLSQAGGDADRWADPADLPPSEQRNRSSRRETRPLPVLVSLPTHGPTFQELMAESVYGPITPAEETADTGAYAQLLAGLVDADTLGPPTDLAPTLGPPLSWSDIEFNRKRNLLLSDKEWWSLLGRDSVLGPPSPGYRYAFGRGPLLGPPVPSDSALAAWAATERSNPARLEREARLATLEERKAYLTELQTAASTQFKLAELYRFDLGYPDSALTEYEHLIDQYHGTAYAAKALLGAADILISLRGDTASGREYLRRITREHPYTDYAGDAIGRLGLSGTAADTAHPAWAYAKAERAYIDEDNSSKARRLLKDFVTRYPDSRLIPSAEFSLAFLTEHEAQGNDSSVVWAYQDILAAYPQSEWAAAAQAKLTTTVQRPTPRHQQPLQEQEGALAAADSAAQSDTAGVAAASLPRAPKPKEAGQFQFPQSEVGSDMRPHVIVYAIRIDFLGDIAEYDVLQPSPSYNINEAARHTLENTTFWADSIAPDSLNIWYRYELTIQPPARELDEFDRLGISPTRPEQSLDDEEP